MLTLTSMMPTTPDRKSLILDFAGFRKSGVGASLLLFFSLFLSSCGQCCSCHSNQSESWAVLLVDWKMYSQDFPSGMSVYFFEKETGNKNVILTHQLDAVDLLLPPGEYSVLCISQSEYEYDSMLFQEMEAASTAKIMGKTLYAPSWVEGIQSVIQEPEAISADMIETIVVGKEGSNWCSCPYCQCLPMHSNPEKIGKLFPRNLIWKINISVDIEGQARISKIRGLLNGVYSGAFLSDGRPVEETSSLILTQWNGLNASVKSFGLSSASSINLQFLLKDGTVVEQAIEHFESIDIDEDEKDIKIKIKIEEPLPNVKPESSGGFDADVNVWGEDEDLNLPM